jgi:hypothetical protein
LIQLGSIGDNKMNEKQYKKYVQLLKDSATMARQKQIKNINNKELNSYYTGRDLAYQDSLAMLQEVLEDETLK